ncbi:MAG: hypothetical protein M3018_02395 [Actinomycetota bacterium]|nr:hypothetical protein [Actinomycetota bacterium]
MAGSLALALAGGAIAEVASVANASATAAPRASLTGFLCQTALGPLTRGIAVTAVMRPVPATVSMQVKFELLRMVRRGAASKLVRARKGNLGKWISPANASLGQVPTDVWKPTGEVANLPAPDYYRLRVSFRWMGSGNVKLAQTVRISAVCYEPELRPNLVVRSISIAPIPSKPGEDAYDAVIANRGATATGRFDISLTEAQTVVDTTSLPDLSPHRVRRAHLTGPACTPGEVITVTADPAHRVNVSTRTRSTLSVVCP